MFQHFKKIFSTIFLILSNIHFTANIIVLSVIKGFLSFTFYHKKLKNPVDNSKYKRYNLIIMIKRE